MKSRYRYVARVPRGYDLSDFGVGYVTEYLYSSAGSILESDPDVEVSEAAFVSDPKLIKRYALKESPGFAIKIIEETVLETFDFVSDRELTLQEFHESLTWEERYESWDSAIEMLDRVVVEDEFTWDRV